MGKCLIGFFCMFLFAAVPATLFGSRHTLDTNSLRKIKKYFLQTKHTFATYQAILNGIVDGNNHYRFFAVQAGLAIPVLYQEVLEVSIKDADPAILNLVLAALERNYHKKFSAQLVKMILQPGNTGWNAFVILKKHDIPALKHNAASLFMNSELVIQKALLKMVEQGQIVLADNILELLIRKLKLFLGERLLVILVKRGRVDLFPKIFASWDVSRQGLFLKWIEKRTKLLKYALIVRLLDKCGNRGLYYCLYNMLLKVGNKGLRARLAAQLRCAVKIEKACLYARDLLRFKENDAVSKYAKTVLRLQRCLSLQKKIQRVQPSRKKQLKRMVEMMRATRDSNTEKYIEASRKRLTEYRLLQRLYKKEKQRIAAYISIREGHLFKKRFLGLLRGLAL